LRSVLSIVRPVLQPLEECQQLIIGPVSTRRWCVRWSGLCQGLFLERQVGLEVHLGGFDRFALQPEGFSLEITARYPSFTRLEAAK